MNTDRSEATAIVDHDWRIIFASPGMLSLFGLSLDALVGSSIFTLMPEKIRAGQQTLWSLAPLDRRSRNIDAVGLRDEHSFPLAVQVSAFQSGETHLRALTFVDKTPIAPQNSESQKMEALGLLAGGVAHDFNNVLTSIMGLTQAVKDDLPAGSILIEDLEEVLLAASSAGELTQQLLSFARRRPVQTTVIELNRSVEAIDKLLRRSLPASITLELHSEATDLPVIFAPSDLHRILINLATNANDAMPDGGRIQITLNKTVVERTADLAAGSYATISVCDSGTGIAEDSVSRVFDPFFSTKGEHGTGLGLSTCFGIAKQCGGALTVNSSIGTGTTFTLYLPLSEVAAATSSLETTEGTRIRRHQGVALVVEDESSIRKYIKRTVVKSGLTTLVAESAEEAIRLANSLVHPPVLLVSDIVLPGQSGSDLAVKLRQDFPDLKVLLTSGRVDGVPDNSESNIGFLPKPFTARELRRRIERLMNPPRTLTGDVLLIEPDLNLAQGILAAFGELGMSMLVAHSGEQARQNLESTVVPGLILLSLNLPDGSAQQFLEWTRKRPQSAEVPIVLIESSRGEYGRECGDHTSVLCEPVTDAKLCRALERVGLMLG